MLGFKYATYFDEERARLQKTTKISEEKLSKDSYLKYSLMFFNEMIYSNIISLKDDLVRLGLYKFAIKKNYNEMRKEINSYITLLKGNINIDEIQYADISITMEENYKGLIDNLHAGIDKEMRERRIKRDKRILLSRLLLMRILYIINKTAIECFKDNILKTVGIKTDILDFFRRDKIDYFSDKIQREIIGEGEGEDFSDSQYITHPFNVLINKVISKNNFGKILKQTEYEHK